MSMTLEAKELLLGDEAIAQGALDAGISGAYAYPGTPSTEILEYIQHSPLAADRGVHRQWSVNEKTAMEEALGMSYAGKRALVAMKHVGLNVASDAFINAAITGINGGLVVVVADDPSMHSSQNEQDSRYYAKFSHIPCLEPSRQQEAYDMAYAGLELSEKTGLPIMLRLTTRLAHSRAEVERRPLRPENKVRYPGDPRQFILLPANARRNYAALIKKQPELLALSEDSGYNVYIDGADRSLGIIAAGVAYNYLQEVFAESPCPHPLLKIGQYPVPKGMVNRLVKSCEAVLVIEEGYPFIEEMLTGILDGGPAIRGRLDGTLPRMGELSPDDVMAALGQKPASVYTVPSVVAPRPPSMCKGCPHIDSYNFMKDALGLFAQSRVFADIGCYTLGALAPFEAIHSCVDMGASITMAKGAADAGVRPSVAVIGDSTFMHSGMTGLLDAIAENTPVTLVILDNDAVAMTGGQVSLAEGRLKRIVLGLGVDPDHLRSVVPIRRDHEKNIQIIREEFEYEGVSVIIAERECIQTVKKG